jgi:hypothetical protein
MDLPDTDKAAQMFKAALKDQEVFLISTATRKGINPLILKLIKLLELFHDSK